ncbi:MAG TPA: DUF2254 family protein, partial [Streptosporangiaceae bacterium]
AGRISSAAVSPVTGEPGEARWTTARSGSVDLSCRTGDGARPPGAERAWSAARCCSPGHRPGRSFLSAIVQAMISFTAVVLSITIVVLQLSSSQFSPRVLRHFMQDRGIQSSLGVFVAT